MRLGIIVILIGIAWCVRCYLLRPQSLTSPAEIGFQVHGNTIVKDFPYDPELAVLFLGEPIEGETIEWTYWSTPDTPLDSFFGGSRHSHARRVMTFTGGKWVETERYPKGKTFTNNNH